MIPALVILQFYRMMLLLSCTQPVGNAAVFKYHVVRVVTLSFYIYT